MIPTTVKRFMKPDKYFSRRDRSVPVVAAVFADKSNLRRHSVLVEEYIAEQLAWGVVDECLVLAADSDVTYLADTGLEIPDRYDVEYSRAEDDLPVYSWEGYMQWALGAKDEALKTYRLPPHLLVEQDQPQSNEIIEFHWEGDTLNTNYFESDVAKQGFAYLVHNADSKRLILLTPPKLAKNLEDMKAAKEVVAYFGYHSDYGRKMWRVVFDDETSHPYVVCLGAATGGATHDDNGWTFEVLLADGVAMSRPLRIRAQKVLSGSF